MKIIQRVLLNRNFILILAVFMGLTFGDFAVHLKDYNVFILAITMTFSLTGLDLSLLSKPKLVVKPFMVGILLNHFVFGLVLLLTAWILIPTKELFYGFVVIVAAPPGVAIIPFSYILKGRVDYAIIAVTGAFLASIFLAPILVQVFAKNEGVKSIDLFFTMIQLVVLPLIVAQLLRQKNFLPVVQEIRGRVVDWGFALLIFVAVGLNRHVFFSEPRILVLVSLTLFIGIFILGSAYRIIAKKIGIDDSTIRTQIMLVTIKSSGFSVFTALALFGKEAAIPSAVLAVMVLFYLIFLSISERINPSLPT